MCGTRINAHENKYAGRRRLRVDMKIREMLKDRLNREAVYTSAEYWDKKATEHEGDATSMWPNNNLNYYYHREQMELMERFLPDLRGLSVLDLCCGTGRTSRFLAGHGAQVLGIDFSQKAIDIARRMSSGDNPGYRLQSIYDLDEMARFDLAVTWAATAMACKNRTDLLNVLVRLRRAMKPQGRVLLGEPIHRGFLHRVLNMNAKEYCAAMQQAGFRVLKVHHLHFWPMRLLLAYLPWPKPITAAGFYAGRAIMALLADQAFGDYKVFYACVRESEPGLR
jgi:2-polyprenyl-3-methyl-5-hydroxy-6-metoxy-1,4-benzoquinol methylase